MRDGELHQSVEEGRGVVGAAGGLGVVLDGVGGEVEAAQPSTTASFRPTWETTTRP